MANQPFKADKVLLNAGSASSPSVASAAFPATGFFFPSNGIIGVTSAGTQSFRLASDSIFGGNVNNSLQLTSGGSVSLSAAGSASPITLNPGSAAPVIIGAGGFVTPSAGTGIAYGLAINGLNLAGAGSTNDVVIFNKSGGAALTIPTGSTNVLFAGLNVNGIGVAQFPAATTPAGGITLGGDNLYRYGSGLFAWDTTNTTAALALRLSGVSKSIFENTGGNTVVADLAGNLVLQSNSATSLTLDPSHNALFVGSIATVAPTGGAGVWKLGKYTAGVLVQAGSVLVNIDGVDRTLLTA